MRTYLANAWSAGMIPAEATAAIEVAPLTLEEAREHAVGAVSIVGHADTAALLSELLGHSVAHNRASVTLAPGDTVIVAQLEGGRLPEGARTLPPDTRIRWMRVRWTAPRKAPSISAPFRDPAFVASLAERTGEVGGPLDVLVAIPSNDSVLAMAVATQARKVLLLVTGTEWRAQGEDYAAWLRTHVQPPPEVQFVPDADDDALDERNLIGQLDDAVRRAKRVGVLVTTGTSVHAALLSHYAHASGARTLHVAVPYVNRRPDSERAERGLQVLDVPAEVRHRLRLEEARELATGGNFERARARLDGCVTLGPLRDATLDWIAMLDAREALRLDEARVKHQRLVDALDRLTRAERTSAPWAPLDRAAARASQALVATQERTLDHELHFAAEALHRAEQETRRGRLDLAALLYYRYAEAAVAARLRYARTPAVDPDRGLGEDEATALGKTLDEAAHAVHGATARPIGARTPLGLVSGLIVLYASGDPAVHAWSAPLETIRTIKTLGDRRNKSIFAHGFQPMQAAELEPWRGVARGPLFALLHIGENPRWGPISGAHAP